MTIKYGGGHVDIPAGGRYYVDSFERVLVGWHGSYDPPCGMDDYPMINDAVIGAVEKGPTELD